MLCSLLRPTGAALALASRENNAWSPSQFNIWVVLSIRALFRVLFIRVSYYVADLKGDPNLENYLSVVKFCGAVLSPCPQTGE